MTELSNREQRALVERARCGEEGERAEALRRLFECFRAPALACIARTLRSAGFGYGLAEDCLHLAFVKFIERGLTQYKGEAGPRAYFCRIAIHTAMDMVRRRKEVPFSEEERGKGGRPMLESQCGPMDASVELLVERKELYEVLLGCVKKLPDRLRSAVAAYYFDKKGSCADCAELLGIKLNTMEQRLSRARQALKECVRRRVGR